VDGFGRILWEFLIWNWWLFLHSNSTSQMRDMGHPFLVVMQAGTATLHFGRDDDAIFSAAV
jgi:hypothetical protein